MKLKSFKKKGAAGDRLVDYPIDPITVDHCNYPIDQITVDSKQRYLEIMWQNDNDGVRLDTGDVVAVTIDDGPYTLLAKIREVSKVGDRLVFRIEEHEKTLLGSSKQLPSSRWTRFLTELKKKCDSGHHNKKRKTLLHVIKMAQSREAYPESIQLQIRQRLLEADKPEINEADLRAAVEKIQRRIDEAAAEGESLALDELDELLEAGEIVTDANHTHEQGQLEAMTILMNGVSVTTSKTSSNKQRIAISEKALERALIYNNQPNGPVEFFEGGDLENLLDTTKQRVMVYVYSHDRNLIMHSNKYVKHITRSSNGKFVFELESDLAAGSGTFDLENVFLAITSYDPVVELVTAPVDSVEPETDSEKNKMLEISSYMYRFASDVDTNKHRIEIEATFEASRQLRQFQPGDTYFVSVDDTNAVFTVDSVVDGVTEEPKKEWILLSHKGGAELFEFEAERKPFIMKKLHEASPPRNAAIQLTLEKRDLLYPAYPDANLVEIAAEIDDLIWQDQDGVTLNEVGVWLDENHNLTQAVTGVKYKPREPAYHTESIVTGGLKLDVWMSAGREYTYVDLEPVELANVESVSHISTIVNERPESEVKGRSAIQLMEEVRQQVWEEVRRQALFAEVDPDPLDPERFFSQYLVSVYSMDGGLTVCNNEPIWRILRKKKDGKCIYRIVVKNGVRANRIHHGKHRKCIMYLDQKTYPS